MAITEFDLLRMQIAIDSSCYKTPEQRKKAQKQKEQQRLSTRSQAEYHVITKQFDTRAKKTFMEKYGQDQNNSFTGLDAKQIKESVSSQIDAKTQTQIENIVNTPARQAFYQKYGQGNNTLAVDTQAQIDKITDTPAKRAFMEKYGQQSNTLQNDQVTLSQEAFARLLAEKFPAQTAKTGTTQDSAASEPNKAEQADEDSEQTE